MKARRSRRLTVVLVLTVGLLALAGCGGGDDTGSSGVAEVGACIDASSQVVDCNASSATQRLVTDQSEPDAIACVAIGDAPQTEVTVDGTPYCAEDL